MTTTITTRTDIEAHLETWLGSGGMDGNGGMDYDRLTEFAGHLSGLAHDGGFSYGDDWTEFFDSLDWETDVLFELDHLPGWFADDGNCEVHFPDHNDGHDAAQEYVAGGDWNSPDKSFAVPVHYYRKHLDGEIDDSTTGAALIIVHPPEPACSHDDGHDWQAPYEIVGGIRENPGVWGIGGAGISSSTVCLRCGMGREERTATQGRDTEYDHEQIIYTQDEYTDRLVAE